MDWLLPIPIISATFVGLIPQSSRFLLSTPFTPHGFHPVPLEIFERQKVRTEADPSEGQNQEERPAAG